MEHTRTRPAPSENGDLGGGSCTERARKSRSNRSGSTSTAQVPSKHSRLEDRNATPPLTYVAAMDINAIPTSQALLSKQLRREMLTVWGAAADPTEVPPLPSSSTSSSARGGTVGVVPPFKVGTAEMYRRFPEAYDVFMRHHNCAAVQEELLHHIMDRIVRSADGASTSVDGCCPLSLPWVRVADFGCGTGRIESMVVAHPAVHAIYAYDSEVPMLQRCLVNTVRSAAQAGHYETVILTPTAGGSPEEEEEEHITASSPSPPLVFSRGRADEKAAGSAAELRLCLRPVPFEAVQRGFLEKTRHPPCQLVVCAWSLSHVMRMQWGQDHWHATVDTIVQSLLQLLDNTRSDAAVVILETLGNGSPEPTRQSTYTQRLEEHFGFTRTWVRTDYEFDNAADAERMVRFFFGDAMLKKLSVDKDVSGAGEAGPAQGAEETAGASRGRYRLMECTGIWVFWKARAAGSQKEEKREGYRTELGEKNGKE